MEGAAEDGVPPGGKGHKLFHFSCPLCVVVVGTEPGRD